MRLTDVTVREGAQMPGRTYTAEQRIRAGQTIDRLGVDRIQSGFPVGGEVEREVVRELSETVDAKTVAIARALKEDVKAALEANADIIEVFAPVSDAHLEHGLDKSRKEVLSMLEDAVKIAKEGGVEVQLAILDGFRTAPEHLLTVFNRFDDVPIIGLADTVGRRSPKSVRSMLERLSDHVDMGRVSVHFHNDLGVGTANVMTAYEAGVANADVSIGALGERVGNPALEEVVAVGDLEYDDTFDINREQIVPIAEELFDALGERYSARKPLLGREATTHEAGLHTAAMLNKPSLFEPFNPARFGGERTLIFGEGTGRGAARTLLSTIGIDPTEDRVTQFLRLLDDEGPMNQEEAHELAQRRFS